MYSPCFVLFWRCHTQCSKFPDEQCGLHLSPISVSWKVQALACNISFQWWIPCLKLTQCKWCLSIISRDGAVELWCRLFLSTSGIVTTNISSPHLCLSGLYHQLLITVPCCHSTCHLSLFIRIIGSADNKMTSPLQLSSFSRSVVHWPWLKSKVLYADHRVVVLIKPSNFVCQLHQPTTNTGICLSSYTFICNWNSIFLIQTSDNITYWWIYRLYRFYPTSHVVTVTIAIHNNNNNSNHQPFLYSDSHLPSIQLFSQMNWNTGKGFGEAFELFLFDSSESPSCDHHLRGVDDGNNNNNADPEALQIDKLHKDLGFMWRSRLYSDLWLAISFPPQVHPVIQPGDKSPTLNLPSPPFTPASLHFTLGFIYTGILIFSHHSYDDYYDLSTVFTILRAALYLSLNSLHDIIQARIV